MFERIKYWYRAVRYKYKLDKVEIRYILANVKQGQIAVDIGAHKGGYLYWLQKKVGSKGWVFAFEPQPKLSQYLLKICAKKKYKNVIIENMGVSAQKGSFDLFLPNGKSSSPGASLQKHHKTTSKFHNSIEIQTTTLDEYFLKERYLKPHFLKIDVEGHELEVFKGGEQLLKEVKPKILVECEQRHLHDTSIDQVFQFLLDLGYKGYFIHQNEWKPLIHFSVGKHQRIMDGRYWMSPDYCNNFIFE
ncbi:MAG: FkbM family methyltransferase [Chitinophagales bacterium]